MNHLTENQIAAYWNGTMVPVDLLALDRHISQCGNCREALANTAPPDSFLAEEDPGGHLEYEQLEEYVKGAGSREVRAAVESHCATCHPCALDLQDLQQFHNEYHRDRPPARRPFGPILRIWWLPVAAGLAIAMGLALLWRTSRIPVEPLAVMLHDGGRTVGLDRKGLLHGFANLPGDDSTALVAILSGASLPFPRPPTELSDNGGMTRSATPKPVEFSVVDPQGRITLEDRPLFAWNSLSGASSYRVQVLDLDYRVVAESPPLTATQWRTDKILTRGSAYVWQVIASRGSEEIRAPQPPASEARFLVLHQAGADRVAAAVARTPVSHLALTAVYAEEGLKQECLNELRQLEAENPGSRLVTRLRAGIAPR